MAYVQPNSIIQLFKGINLDNRYLHTIYFANATAQNNWFSSKVFRTYQRQSYNRYTVNQLKLQADATELLGVTYMRFMNDRSVDKWFYAFVLSCEYLNENTTVITYEIDVMQTWFMQGGSIRPCRVLREHVNDDTFGLNLEEEPIGGNVYDNDFITQSNEFDKYAVVIESTGEPDNNELMQKGMFVGSKYYYAPCDNLTDAGFIKSTLHNLIGDWSKNLRSEDVINFFTIPKWVIENTNFVNHAITVTAPTSFDNYVPKNKKLFSYPYSYLQCTTMNGEGGIFKWEYFDGTVLGNNLQFDMYGTEIGGGQIVCYPREYNGIEENIDVGISMTNFPKNSFSYDAYQAWIANGGKDKYEDLKNITTIKGVSTAIKTIQGMTRDIGKGISGGLDVAGGIMNENPAQLINGVANIGGGAMNMSTRILDTAANLMEARNKVKYTFNDAMYEPNQVVGNSVPNVVCGLKALDYYFYHTHIRDDEAKRVDDFFSCYGYSINRVKVPNLTGRRYWNFVQTENCVIAGDMPASSKEAIGRIFDGGITLWHNGDNVGNYLISTSQGTIDNPIV